MPPIAAVSTTTDTILDVYTCLCQICKARERVRACPSHRGCYSIKSKSLSEARQKHHAVLAKAHITSQQICLGQKLQARRFHEESVRREWRRFEPARREPLRRHCRLLFGATKSRPDATWLPCMLEVTATRQRWHTSVGPYQK